MIKKLVLILFLLLTTLYAETDLRLNHYPQALKWLQDADTNGESAYNIGVLYHETINDDNKAIEWYEKAYGMKDREAAGSSANNLGYIYDNLEEYKKSKEWYKKGITKNNSNSSLGIGLLYKKLHQYNDAIFYYKKAYKMGNIVGANNLGYLYQFSLKNYENAENWYKIASKENNQQAIGNLAKLYHKQNKSQLGAAYLISLVDNGYTKLKVISYLKTKWNLSDEEIKKAYKLQLTLDIPNHYTGGIN